jgi:hypothetical protein
MIKAPGRFVPLSGPRMAGWVARLARHLISAGQGCDAELRAETPPAPRHQAPEDGR